MISEFGSNRRQNNSKTSPNLPAELNFRNQIRQNLAEITCKFEKKNSTELRPSQKFEEITSKMSGRIFNKNDKIRRNNLKLINLDNLE